MHENAENFYNAGLNEWRLCGCFTKRELTNFETYSLNKAEEILSRCNSLGIDVITIDDKEYPKRLKMIDNPPCVLYVKGKLPDLDELITIGVVGTRSATSYGLNVSYKLSNELASMGAVIVSGGAVGIDSSAHKGALNAGGKTVLVMGCGINYNYLMENIQMRRSVSENGALISEYPPDTPPLPRNFPMRNRIISGLSIGVLVIEAGEKSGSLITANVALEQNRDLFAVPGNINSSVSEGTNRLIKECAKPVVCANDILEEYTHLLVGVNAQRSTHVMTEEVSCTQEDQVVDQLDLKENLSDDAIKLFNTLSKTPKHADDLVRETNIQMKNLLQAVTELELVGLIKSLSGRRYSK